MTETSNIHLDTYIDLLDDKDQEFIDFMNRRETVMTNLRKATMIKVKGVNESQKNEMISQL